MKALLIILAVLIGLIALVLIVGLLLPKSHSVSLSRSYSASSMEVWSLISEFKNYNTWRSGLKELTVIDENTWVEVDDRGDKITFRKVEELTAERLVTKIVDENLPFGGSWTLELEKEGEDVTKLTITEDGEIYHPIFRFFAHFVFGYEATAKKYMNDLEKQLTPSHEGSIN